LRCEGAGEQEPFGAVFCSTVVVVACSSISAIRSNYVLNSLLFLLLPFPPNKQEALVAHRKSLDHPNGPVTSTNFGSSPHVLHYREHGEEYERLVREFLGKAMPGVDLRGEER